MTSLTETTAEVREIPLDLIRPSKMNSRKTFQKLEELAKNIERVGIQQPLLLRPHPAEPGHFELIAGERRWRASKLAGKTTAPSIVRNLNDLEALEIQVIENDQREDLTPLERAKGYEQLLKQHGDAATVAAKVDRDPHEVTRVLQLLKLIEPAKDALNAGEILPGHAFELCRLKPPEQKLALDFLFEKNTQIQTRNGWKSVGKRAVPVADLKVWIRNNLILDLSKAPFDVQDASLNTGRGPCTSCPNRSGNAPGLFEDLGSGELCTVPPCFFRKRNAAIENMVKAQAAEHGVKSVLRLAVGWNLTNKSEGSIPPFDKCLDGNSDVALVEGGDECEFTKAGVIVYREQKGEPKVGQFVSVCTSAGYQGKCKKHNGRSNRSVAARPKPSPTAKANQRIENWKKEQPEVVLAAVAKAAVEAAKKVKIASPLLKQVLVAVASEAFDHVYSDRYRDVGKGFGLEPEADKNHSGRDWQTPLVKFTGGNPVALLVLSYCAHNFGTYSAAKVQALAKMLKVDTAKIATGVNATLKERVAGELERAKRSEERRKKQAAKKDTKAGEKTAMKAPKRSPAARKQNASGKEKVARAGK